MTRGVLFRIGEVPLLVKLNSSAEGQETFPIVHVPPSTSDLKGS